MEFEREYGWSEGEVHVRVSVPYGRFVCKMSEPSDFSVTCPRGWRLLREVSHYVEEGLRQHKNVKSQRPLARSVEFVVQYAGMSCAENMRESLG